MIIIVFERAARCYDGEPKPTRQKLDSPIFPAFIVPTFNMGLDVGKREAHICVLHSASRLTILDTSLN